MKKSDIAMVALIAGFSIIVAFVAANMILGDPNEKSVKVQYMDVISSEIAQPDPELFNALAINPTVEAYVGKCKDNETWDATTNKCVSNTPTENTEDDESAGDEDDESAEDEDTDTGDETADESEE